MTTSKDGSKPSAKSEPKAIAKSPPLDKKAEKERAQIQAKAVVSEMNRSKNRRTFVLLTLLAAVIALAILYLKFGDGWGLGFGSGTGKGDASGTTTVTAPAGSTSAKASASVASAPSKTPCALRLTSTGITVDGVAMEQPAAIAKCKEAGAATVVVPGDVTTGAWTALQKALDEAKITYTGGPPPVPPTDSAAPSASAAPATSASASP